MKSGLSMVSALALACSLVGCARSQSVQRATSMEAVDTESPSEVAPTRAFEVHELTIATDVRAPPLALVEADDGPVLFTTESAGIGRHAIDLDALTATRKEIVPVDGRAVVVEYDRALDRLWWTVPIDTRRLHESRRETSFPRGSRVVTLSNHLAHSEGLRGTIRLCPTPGAVGGGEPTCDHAIRVMLPAFGGVVLGGHLTEPGGTTSWIGFADASGTLTVDRRLQEGGGAPWIDALAESDGTVLAIAWNGSHPVRASVLLFEGPTLDPVSAVTVGTPSSVTSPWAAAVAAPDEGFWVVLPTTSHQLTFVSIARDGSIESENTIEGIALPRTSSQWLGVRDGDPWLTIASPVPSSRPRLTAHRIDAPTATISRRDEVPLPAEFWPTRMLMLERGLLLAGVAGLDQVLVTWIPLAHSRP